MYLAQNLKYLREQKGLSQRDFSADLGLSCAAIGMWEQNHRKPDIEMIIRLAEYFGITLDDLVLRDLKPPIPKYAGNIRYLRLSHGITQEQMGELLGLKNKSSLSLIEAGKSGISVENLEKLADFFGVTLDVMILRYAKEIRQEDFDLLRYIHDDRYDKMYEKYLDMRQYTTIYKVDKYIKKQGIKHDADYFDYIRWLEEMEYDMRNEFNLYPKDFKKAHDDKSKEYVKFKDKRAKEDIKRFNKLLKKLRKDTSDVDAMNLRVEGMFIRLPAQLDELKREGEILHHCVGTYVDKVAKGETMIFFIRQESDPDKPFFTLEWKGRVVQCRGYHNCDMTPEVKAFVNIFQQKMVEYENEPKKQRKAG